LTIGSSATDHAFLLPGVFNPTTAANSTLNVTGTVTFNAVSELFVVANGNGSGQYSVLNVTGNVIVNGSPTVGLSQNYTVPPTGNLTIISATGSVTGSFTPVSAATQHNGPGGQFNFTGPTTTMGPPGKVVLVDPLFPEESSAAVPATTQVPPPDLLPVVPNDFPDAVRGLAQALLAAAGMGLKLWPGNTAGPPGLPFDAVVAAVQDLAVSTGQATLTRSERGAVIGGLGGADGDQAPDGLDALPAPLASDADQRLPPDE
jgi:hypothetical protein